MRTLVLLNLKSKRIKYRQQRKLNLLRKYVVVIVVKKKSPSSAETTLFIVKARSKCKTEEKSERESDENCTRVLGNAKLLNYTWKVEMQIKFRTKRDLHSPAYRTDIS